MNLKVPFDASTLMKGRKEGDSMIILFGTPGWGWRMFGLLGKHNKWFLGLSFLNKRVLK